MNNCTYFQKGLHVSLYTERPILVFSLKNGFVRCLCPLSITAIEKRIHIPDFYTICRDWAFFITSYTQMYMGSDIKIDHMSHFIN